MSRKQSWQRGVIGVALASAIALCGCNAGESDDGAAAPPRVGYDVWSRYTASSDRIAQLLQPREVTVELFTPTLGDEIKELGDKLKQTAENDPHGFLSLVGSTPAGEAPPFDPRIGLTREEYDALITGSHLKLNKTASAAVAIVARPKEQFLITGLPGLKELTIDAALQIVKTPYGEVVRPSEVTADEPAPLTGPLVGYRWSEVLAPGSLRPYRLREITLGQSPADGAVWLIVNIVETLEERPVVECFARFTGPQE